jgi:hypothetical protein
MEKGWYYYDLSILPSTNRAEVSLPYGIGYCILVGTVDALMRRIEEAVD